MLVCGTLAAKPCLRLALVVFYSIRYTLVPATKQIPNSRPISFIYTKPQIHMVTWFLPTQNQIQGLFKDFQGPCTFSRTPGLENQENNSRTFKSSVVNTSFNLSHAKYPMFSLFWNMWNTGLVMVNWRFFFITEVTYVWVLILNITNEQTPITSDINNKKQVTNDK